ncbi:MAG: hypothetical protein R6V67_03580 [Spirochaetia bacterium]
MWSSKNVSQSRRSRVMKDNLLQKTGDKTYPYNGVWISGYFASVTGSRWEERRDAVMTIDRDLFTEAWAAFKQVDTQEASLRRNRQRESGNGWTGSPTPHSGSTSSWTR